MATPFDGLFQEGGVPGMESIVALLGQQPQGLPLQPNVPGEAFQPAAQRTLMSVEPTAAVPGAGFPSAPMVPGISMAPQAPMPTPNVMQSPLVPNQQAAEMAPGNYSWDAIERAIDNIESGGTADRPGRYEQLGPVITNPNSRYFRDRAYGRFQFMGNDIPELTRQYYGEALTPQQFLENREAQHAVFRGRFGDHMRRFGNPVDAAQAHFAGPGSVGNAAALDRTDAQAGFRGTSVRDYRRMFESGLSRYSSGGAQPQAGNTFTSMEVSPDMAGALGLASTNMPAPGQFSPRAAAMAPGLRAAAPQGAGAPGPQIPPGVGPQGPNAPLASGQGGLPFGDLWQAAGAQPSGLTQLASYMAQRPAAAQVAAARVIQRGQELQQLYPNSQPQQIAQMLVRDPVFGQNALMLGAEGPAILSTASQPIVQPSIQVGQPGTQFFQNQGGVLTPTGQGVPPTPPAEMQMLQYFLARPEVSSLPPERQLPAALAMMQQYRQTIQPQSDREQAWARLQQQDPSTYTPEMRDRWLAGLIRPEPVMGPTGNVIGQRWVDTVTGQSVTMGAPRAPGLTPPSSVAPGGGAGASGAAVSPPAAPGAPQQLGAIDTRPRVVDRRRTDNREIIDIPDLALQTTLIRDPSHMAIAGPVASFTGAWGRIVGNIIPGTDEEILARESLLQQFRSAYSTYRRGTRLAGEHAETMSEVPSPGEIFSNPLRAVNQVIGIREGLIRELQLARQQISDGSLDERTRKTASDRVADIQNLLLRLPDQRSLYNLSDDLRRGAAIAGTGLGEVGTRASQAVGLGSRATSQITGGPDRTTSGEPSADTRLPAQLGGLGLDELRRLSRRPGLTSGDRQRLIQAIQDLNPSTGAPKVPRSY